MKKQMRVFSVIVLITFTLSSLIFTGSVASASSVYSMADFQGSYNTTTNFGLANDFNVFVFNDFIQSSSDIQGRAAVGGNVKINLYGIGDNLSPAPQILPSRADLIAGKSLDASGGQNKNGNTIVGSNTNVIAYNFSTPYGLKDSNDVYLPQPLVVAQSELDNFFGNARQYLSNLSWKWGALPANGTAAVNYGRLSLTGTSTSLNVFDIDGNNLAGSGVSLDSLYGIDVVVPSTSTVIINVKGENIGFGNYSINLPDHSMLYRTVWNFPDTNNAYFMNLSFQGSILSPNTDWVAKGNGNVEGTFIASSLKAQNSYNAMQFHLLPFQGTVPDNTGLMPFTGSLNEPAPDPSLKIKKMIVSELGETVKYNAYTLETIKEKIFYQNPTGEIKNLSIQNIMNQSCQIISASNGGVISGQTVTWEIPNVPAYGQGTLEIEFTSTVTALENSKAVMTVDNVQYQSNRAFIRFTEKPDTGWISLKPGSNPGDLPSANMKEQTSDGFMCNFNFPGMELSETDLENKLYHKLTVPQSGILRLEGLPETPVAGQAFEVPYGVDFSIEVYKSDFITIKDCRICPAQPAVSRGSSSVSYSISSSTYTHNADVPEKIGLFDSSQIGVMRGHRIFFLQVNPVQFNPATGEVKLFSNIELKVRFSSRAAIEPIRSSLDSGAFETNFKRVVANYTDPKTLGTAGSSREVRTEPGCDYLILTNGAFNQTNTSDGQNPLTNFSNWKKQMGFDTMIVDVDTLKGTNPSVTSDDIVNYLQNAYNTWSKVPTYVLLVGDSDLVPTCYKHDDPAYLPLHNYKLASDLYYGTLDGTDIYPDIYVGRFSVDTIQQCTDVVNKTINYEKNPPANAAYYNNEPYAALFEDVPDGTPPTSDGREDTTFRIIENAEDIRGHAVANGYNYTRIYNTSSNFAQGPVKYENGTNVPANLTIAGGFNWNGSTADISNAINSGAFLTTFNGHGSRDGWANPSFHNTDVNALTNAGLPTVVFSWACQTGWFDNETDDVGLNTAANSESFCETFLRRPNSGAVAILGSSRNSYEFNDFFTLGAYKALFPDYAPAPPVSGYSTPDLEMGQLPELGQINTFGKIYLAECGFGADTTCFEEYNLFGDPNLAVYTQAPTQLNVDFPSKIGSTGTQSFVVIVKDTSGNAINNAVVTLVRDGDLLAVESTDASGIARFSLTAAEGNDIDLTVTGRNLRSFSDKISVTNNGGSVTLNPLEGTTGQDIAFTCSNFGTVNGHTEDVEVKVAGNVVYSGVYADSLTFEIPANLPTGPVNVIVEGLTTGISAVGVITVRTQNAVDLYQYDQWDSSTYFMFPGDNPTWNSPDIQILDTSNNPVNSGNLEVGTQYRIKCTVHNDSNFDALGASVSYYWADFGIGQTDRVWNLIGEASGNINSNSTAEVTIDWTPPRTGHVCLQTRIDYADDTNTNNNIGQENCQVGVSHSPATVLLKLWNPTQNSAQVNLVLRQLTNNGGLIWPAAVQQPDIQTIAPDDFRDISLSIDPSIINVQEGSEEFSLSGYIDNQLIGGINFIVLKEPSSTTPSVTPTPTPTPVPVSQLLGDYDSSGNLYQANDFNVFIFNDFEQSGCDIQGRAAIGGNVKLSSYGIGDMLSPAPQYLPSRADLIVGNSLDAQNGSVYYGNTLVGTNTTITNYTFSNPYGLRDASGQSLPQPLKAPQNEIDSFFTSAKQSLLNQSQDWSELASNGQVSISNGRLILTGTDSVTNIFSFDGENIAGSGISLDNVYGIDINVPVSSTVLINVGGHYVGFGNYLINLPDRSMLNRTVWNFYEANSAFSKNLSIQGSVLAPGTDWIEYGRGNCEGTFIAMSFKGQTSADALEFHNFPFNGVIPPAQPIP